MSKIVALAIVAISGLLLYPNVGITKAEQAGAKIEKIDKKAVSHKTIHEEDLWIKAKAAADFAKTISKGNKTQFVLAFRDAFNIAAEAGQSTPPQARTPTTSMSPQAVESSIYSDPKYQDNLRVLIGGSGRVFGAVNTNDYPDCVAVGSETQWCCSGTLVAPNIVISAGHCSERCSSRVFIGPSVNKPGAIIRVTKSVRHPDYTQSYRNDLTVLVLAKPVASITPRPIASTSVIDAASVVRVVGYGTTNQGGTEGYGERRVVDVPVASNNCSPSAVSTKYGCYGSLELVAAAPTLDKDSCNGDSGGPIYVQYSGNWYLAGATSRPTANSTHMCGDGGIYVRIDKYKGWILSAGGS